MKFIVAFVAFSASIFGQSGDLPFCHANPSDPFYVVNTFPDDIKNFSLRAQEFAQEATNPGTVGFFADANSSSFPAVAAGEIISLIGAHLTGNDGQQVYGDWQANPLNNTELLVNGSPVPLLYAGWRRDEAAVVLATGEIVAQIPYGLRGNSLPAQIRIWANGAPQCVGRVFTLTVASAATGLVRTAGPNSPAVLQTGAGVLGPGTAVHAGDEIVVYLVGGGAVRDSGFQAGRMTSRAVEAENKPLVTIGGQTAEIEYSGLTPKEVGLYQINFRIPSLSPGTYTAQVNNEQFQIQIQ